MIFKGNFYKLLFLFYLMRKGVGKITIVLVSVIIILLAVLGYGLYTGMKVKGIINSFQIQVQQLTAERDSLRADISSLQNKYNLLEQDVAKIYKTCIKENACKGHFPSVSWYCNNVGDEADYSIASHVCICDSKCDLNATQISR